MSVTFQRNETTVSLPDPIPGCHARHAGRQTVGRTCGGSVYVYDKGPGILETDPVFESLTDAEKEALRGFFAVQAEGCRYTFTYTDSSGVAWTARFREPSLEFVKVSANVWDTCVRMELATVEA